MPVLFLSHNGMTEALGQSQVLPYLRGLAREGARISIIACEPPGTRAESPESIRALRAELAAEGIVYQALERRHGHGLPHKLTDGAALLAAALRVARRGGPWLVHARGPLAAAAGTVVKALVPGTRLLYDCRGLLTDEYLDMGNWRRGELRPRLTAAFEADLWRRSDHVVVLTQALRASLCAPGGPMAERADALTQIPCCADLTRFRFDADARARARAALGLSDDTLLLVFVGSMARYDMDGALRLWQALRARRDARFLLLTRADTSHVRAAAERAGLAPPDVISAPHHEMAGWLAAADLAVALLQPWPSSLATSPTKIGEGLACGLPTVVRARVGDGDLAAPGLFPVNPDDDIALPATAERLCRLLRDPAAARAAARASAEAHFDLEKIGVARYRAVYRSLGVAFAARTVSETARATTEARA